MAIFTGVFDAGPVIGGPLFGVVVRELGFPAMARCAAALVAAGVFAFAAWDRGR